MKKIDLNELKKIQLDILDNIHKFCKKNNINYWLDCGTLLGAVRHKGYIPWDDDIDIGMLRDDYNKFLELYNKENKHYKLFAVENDKHYYFQFGKVIDTNTILYEPDKETGIKIGVYVDVFVYDNAPDNDKLVEKMYNKRDLLNKFRIAQLFPNNYDKSSFKKKIMRFFLGIYLKFLPKNYYTKKCIKNSKKYVNVETKRVGNFTSDAKFTCDKKIFDSFIEIPFEKKKYMAPAGYDEWLKALYGDYMKLPPKEKQVSNHKFEAYYIGDNNENDFIIGVLGGMGTYATINLFQEYANTFKAEKEWDRPRIIIDNRCTMPSRVRAYLYNENTDKLVNEMSESMDYLTKAGANKIILACMTSHLFLPQIYEKVPTLKGKVLNLIENCSRIINNDGIKEVYLLGSEGTIDSKIFQNELEKYGIKCNTPSEDDYKILRDVIEAVKQNNYTKETKEKFLDLVNRSNYVILGCTELPILYNKYISSVKVEKAYDPLKLALETLKKEYENE